jgi:hypothetical protein
VVGSDSGFQGRIFPVCVYQNLCRTPDVDFIHIGRCFDVAPQHPNPVFAGLRASLERACLTAAASPRRKCQAAKMSSEAQIEALKAAKAEVLRKRWRAAIRKPYPEHLPRGLVVQILAYRLQADLYGDLAVEEAAYLKRAAVQKAPLARFGAGGEGYGTGTVYVREHGGRLHRAVKTSAGFEWEGRKFGSLSAVAFAITGTKWNGLRFFGVQRPEQTRHD